MDWQGACNQVVAKVSSKNGALRKHLENVFERMTMSRIFLEWRRVSEAEVKDGQLQGTKEELATICDALMEVIRDVADLGSAIEQVANPEKADAQPSPVLEDWLTSLSEQQDLEAAELGYELPWLQQHCRDWKTVVSNMKVDAEGDPREGRPDLPRLVRSSRSLSNDKALLAILGRIVSNKCQCG